MIAALCATPGELACLAALMQDSTRDDSPRGMRLLRGRLDQQDLLVLACGVGKVPAAAGSRFLLDHYPIDILVNYGMAGALSPRVRAGDLVIATGLVHGDVGVAHSRAFKPTGPGSCEPDGVLFDPHYSLPPSLVNYAREVAEEIPLPYQLGKILTCDQVVLDPELRAHLGDRFDALAVDMEGAAAAYVAQGEEMPFSAIRAISDELDMDFVGLEKTLPLRGQSRRHLWGKRFLLTVTNPSTALKARELHRGRDVALENLTSFLRVFLSGLTDHLRV